MPTLSKRMPLFLAILAVTNWSVGARISSKFRKTFTVGENRTPCVLGPSFRRTATRFFTGGAGRRPCESDSSVKYSALPLSPCWCPYGFSAIDVETLRAKPGV